MSRHKKAGLISSYNTVHLHRTCSSSSFSCWRKGHGVGAPGLKLELWALIHDTPALLMLPQVPALQRDWRSVVGERSFMLAPSLSTTARLSRYLDGSEVPGNTAVFVLFWPCDRVKMHQHYWKWMRGAPFLLRSCCSLPDFPGSISRGNRIYWFPRRLFFSFPSNTGLHFVENCRKLTRKGHVDFPVWW